MCLKSGRPFQNEGITEDDNDTVKIVYTYVLFSRGNIFLKKQVSVQKPMRVYTKE